MPCASARSAFVIPAESPATPKRGEAGESHLVRDRADKVQLAISDSAGINIFHRAVSVVYNFLPSAPTPQVAGPAKYHLHRRRRRREIPLSLPGNRASNRESGTADFRKPDAIVSPHRSQLSPVFVGLADTMTSEPLNRPSQTDDFRCRSNFGAAAFHFRCQHDDNWPGDRGEIPAQPVDLQLG